MPLVQPTLYDVPGYLREIYKRLQQIEDILDASGTGLLSKTAADTYATRTITGTANQIAVANGGGVAGEPTLTLVVGNVTATAPWTPDLYNVTNVDGSSIANGGYIRLGSSVVFWGQLNLDPTTGTSAIELGIDSPVSSNFATSAQASGACNQHSTDTTARPLIIESDATNNRLRVVGIPNHTDERTYAFIGGMQII